MMCQGLEFFLRDHPLEDVVRDTLTIAIPYHVTETLLLEGASNTTAIVNVRIMISSSFDLSLNSCIIIICSPNIISEVEHLQLITTLVSISNTIVLNFVSIRSYITAILNDDSITTVDTICPVPIVEGNLLSLRHLVGQDVTRVLRPSCRELYRVAEVEVNINSRIVVNQQVVRSIINVQKDITIKHNLTSLSLNENTYQRLTVNRRTALSNCGITVRSYVACDNHTSLTGIDNLCRSILLVPILNNVISNIIIGVACCFCPVRECSILRITGQVRRSKILNELELIVQTECLLLTILKSNDVISLLTGVVTRIDIISVFTLLLEDILLHSVDSQIRLQVNTLSILGTQFERSTTRISDSLLRSIPNVNTSSVSPTFLITSLVTRTISITWHVRLNVLRILIPNQTFQLHAAWNDQSIV